MSATSGTPVVAKKADPKPAVIGVIYLEGGGRREFTSFILFFAARAYYQVVGGMVHAVHTTYESTHLVGEDARKGIKATQAAPLAKAA